MTIQHFNPRSPWGERPLHEVLTVFLFKFQSTLPVGGATPDTPIGVLNFIISIHAPRGGSDSELLFHVLNEVISIHAPRGGSDLHFLC